jgi:hypothetical protein
MEMMLAAFLYHFVVPILATSGAVVVGIALFDNLVEGMLS